MQPQGKQEQDTQAPEVSSYEAPQIKDPSDDTTPLAAAPTIAIPS